MYQRFVENRIKQVMTDTRVVHLTGPRQSGKTTLAEKVAEDQMEFLSLDNPTLLDSAEFDPLGFIKGKDRVVIDEFQRVPDLILAIKLSVDSDKRPGRFLLTGSTDLKILPVVADSLAGRIETIQLFPLSQAEILSGGGNFLDSIFDFNNMKVGEIKTGRKLVELVFAGGYPDALKRSNAIRKNDWYLKYLDKIVNEDIPLLAKTNHLDELPEILKLIAENTDNKINYSEIGSEIGLSHTTIQKYVKIFEGVYLLRSLQPWFKSRLTRKIKTPRKHFLDTGLMTSLQRWSIDKVLQDRDLFKPFLEAFVISEIRKLASWSSGQHNFSFFKNKDGTNVDIIIENQRRQIVGIVVSTSVVPRESEFKDLHLLAKQCGSDFLVGVVFYDGTEIVSFGNQMLAVPISCLWI